MSGVKKRTRKTSSRSKSISSVFGNTPTLPGESAEEYQQGLKSVIEELEAKTKMQVYLAEKIFECLWWMRRYEQQKRATLAREMGRILNEGTHSEPDSKVESVDIINDMVRILNPHGHKEIKEVIEALDYTEEALLQEAFKNKSESISEYDKQITVLAKNLSGFQASYEVLVNRKLHIERLRMQNELLEKDLSAIQVEALPDAGKSKKTGS